MVSRPLPDCCRRRSCSRSTNVTCERVRISVERITEANGTVEEEGRVVDGPGPVVDGVVSSRRGTRDFNYSGYHFIKPGDSFQGWAGEERRGSSGLAGERHVISNERRNGTGLRIPRRICCSCLSLVRNEINFRGQREREFVNVLRLSGDRYD